MGFCAYRGQRVGVHHAAREGLRVLRGVCHVLADDGFEHIRRVGQVEVVHQVGHLVGPRHVVAHVNRGHHQRVDEAQRRLLGLRLQPQQLRRHLGQDSSRQHSVCIGFALTRESCERIARRLLNQLVGVRERGLVLGQLDVLSPHPPHSVSTSTQSTHFSTPSSPVQALPSLPSPHTERFVNRRHYSGADTTPHCRPWIRCAHGARETEGAGWATHRCE